MEKIYNWKNFGSGNLLKDVHAPKEASIYPESY